MSAAVSQVDVPRRSWTPWVGRALGALPVFMLALSASMKLMAPPKVVDMFVNHLGYHAESLVALALLEIACTVLYVVPRTAVLGALALTAYLGGVVATHVRVGDPFVTPVALGILVWVGIYLREPRLRALVPLRAQAIR